ncbi:MAG: translation initiation factor IF-2, partial [Chitinophagaceae bacterium]
KEEVKADKKPEEEKEVKKEEEKKSGRGNELKLKVVGTVDLEAKEKEKKERGEKARKEAADKKTSDEDKAKEVAAKKEESAKQEEKKVKDPEKEAKDKEESKKDAPKEREKEVIDKHETQRVTLTGPKLIRTVDLKGFEKPKKSETQKTDSSKEDDIQKRKRKRKRLSRPVKPTDPSKKPASGTGASGRFSRDDKRAPKRGSKDDAQPQVSEKEIEQKIKDTIAKITGGGKGKTSRSKLRKQKRESKVEDESQEETTIKKLEVTEFISVSELASIMDANVGEVIKTCLDMGIIVSINQRLDAEVIELVADEFGFDVKFIDVTEKQEVVVEEEDDPKDLEERAPIVTIMGHVDHGKTSLLDFVRKENVVAGEAGGITQHIGAYEVYTQSGKKVVFLDTPGHEAFTAMRARGAKATDIAVILIAADDSVMPQTKEAISHAQAAGVPMIFAINKIDKPNAAPDKIREQLSAMNLLVEDWGGKYQSQEISAKNGLNIDILLEKILLEAEMLDLKANPNKKGKGIVIEATLDKGRGYTATILAQEGQLNIGDNIVCGPYYGKIKAMFNERGEKRKNIGPSTPIQILGLNGAPQAGEIIKVVESDQEAKGIAQKRIQIEREQGLRTKKHITLDEIGRRLALGTFKELNVIIKGDVDGSIEALADALLKLSTTEIQVNIVHKAVGAITESDVLLATASDAVIIGFQVRPSVEARKLAEKENLDLRLYSVIYDAIDEVKTAMEGMLEPKIEESIKGTADVKEVFKITKVGTVAGCVVSDGKIYRGNKLRLIRDGIVIYSGEMLALKRFKDDVKEVFSGQECGLSIKDYNDIKVGDVLEAFEEKEVKRKL